MGESCVGNSQKQINLSFARRLEIAERFLFFMCNISVMSTDSNMYVNNAALHIITYV